MVNGNIDYMHLEKMVNFYFMPTLKQDIEK